MDLFVPPQVFTNYSRSFDAHPKDRFERSHTVVRSCNLPVRNSRAPGYDRSNRNQYL